MKTIHQVVATGQIQRDWTMYIKGKIKNYERIRWEATNILHVNMNVCREVICWKEVFAEKRQYILNSTSYS